MGVFVIVPGLALIAGAAQAEDWPMFHHDLALSGYTSSPAPDTNAVLWTYQTNGAVHSSPAVVGDRVFVGSMDGNLYCLDKWTGALNWSFASDGRIYSSPAVAGGRVYFLSTAGTMWALSAATGFPAWSTPLGGAHPWDWGSPAVHGGNVFIVSSNGSMYSLDAATGLINWSTFIGGSPDSPLSVVNGVVYSGTHNFNNFAPTLVAVDEATGLILWTYDYFLFHGGIVGMVNSNGAAVVDADADGLLEIFFGVYNWNGVSNQAVCLDEMTGSELWSCPLFGNSTSTPAVHGGSLFIGADDNQVHAIDAVTGLPLWTFMTGAPVWSAPAVSGDGKVCFGSLDHFVYCVNEADGSPIWSYDTGASRMEGSPAIVDGLLFIGNENGKVYAFGLDCPPEPDPATQGYWHRQCLGVPEAEGGIDPGRNGRGPQAPTEPMFVEELMVCADGALEDLGLFGVTTCDGLDADPANDPCQKAQKQLTALILNVCSFRLGYGCEVDLSAYGCFATDIGGLLDELAGLILGGDCNTAKACAAALNEGEGLAGFEAAPAAATSAPRDALTRGIDRDGSASAMRR